MSNQTSPRRTDVKRRTGPFPLPGSGSSAIDTVILSFRVPPEQDGATITAYGWEVAPNAGSPYCYFTILEDGLPVPDYRDEQSQSGTVPIPFTARIPLRGGSLIEVVCRNEDPVNTYNVNARFTVERV